MDRELVSRQLKLFVVPGPQLFNDQLLHLHNDLYDFWHSVWSQTFGELYNGKRKMYSDDFLRQAESTFITHEG